MNRRLNRRLQQQSVLRKTNSTIWHFRSAICALEVMLPLCGWAGWASPVEAPQPDFIPTVRAYGGGGYDDFQRRTMKDLGLEYVQGLVDFTWDHLERGDNIWNWGPADEQMDRLAEAGLKVIPLILCPKSPGLPWDTTVTRSDSQFLTQYEELAYEVVNRYHQHRAWSGLVALLGGSADVWDRNHPLTDPEVVVRLLNAAYGGVKRADQRTIVIGFNFATTAHHPAEWELYHKRAFALKPKFDWYGVHSHMAPATWLKQPGAYTGVAGLLNVRKFLDNHGYADKPLWMNESGFRCGEDLGGLPEQPHAEQIVQNYIIGRALNVNLKGWVYFDYFAKNHRFEDGADYGLMSPLDEHNPPKPRQAWLALQTLIKSVCFFDYDFDSRITGQFNLPTPPFLLRWTCRQNPSAKLWVVFSPWGLSKQEPVVQDVAIRIAPAIRASLTTMLGKQSIVQADSSGYITVSSTSSPLYVKVGE
jgi:hypothetical protein